MLTSLSIKNYALIESIDLTLDSGFTVITGETGAGKSILIDALGLLLGERSTAEAVRAGTDKAIVEGVFDISRVDTVGEWFRANESESSEELIVRREVSAKGTSRCFVNDSPVTLAQLKDLGDRLVDLHGQHEHQSLLRAETHCAFLDDFGSYGKELEAYAEAYASLASLSARKRHLRERELQLKEKKALYEFQIRDIDAIAPKENEEEELEAELKLLENSETLSQTTSQLNDMLYEGETSVRDNLVRVREQLEDLCEIDPTFSDSLSEAKSAAVIVDELAKYIQQYQSRIEFNPERLDEIRERLGAFTLLKKKYGGTIESVMEHRRRIGEEYALAENFEAEIARIDDDIEQARHATGERALAVSAKRRETGKKIEKEILSALSELGIQKAKFSVALEQRVIDGQTPHALYVNLGNKKIAALPRGVDEIEFFLSTNVGEEVKPLAKVASGGEVSRIMLALKSALAHSDKTPVLIFDEIDTGVSGRIGQAVGLSLKKLSQFHQVIAITHLPQIAALGATHLAVEKTEQNKRTVTRVRRLEGEERVREVAKLLSGAEITDAGLNTARELMRTA
ncbi:MAG TPA: DNA repair protein RecN [Bacteroidota bacterium]|nr:DNA repair protein RecN [Bacteroidota bacterium]